jgi:hypothetical protein
MNILARRLIVIVAGFTVLIVGVAMNVLPGPAHEENETE